jgi:hypothetical protein
LKLVTSFFVEEKTFHLERERERERERGREKG